MKLVAMALAGLVLVQGCAGSMAQHPRSQVGSSVSEPASQEPSRNEDQAKDTAKSSVWPWIVGGAAVATVAFVGLVYLAAEGSAKAVGQAAANSAGSSGRSNGPITVAQGR